jgi:CheY-like chemotaxis protein
VSIKDTGPGIPRAIISKIFDPFFSTKAEGHGLGLSTCYSIAKRHGGFLEVDSELGKGSTFHLFLPASPEVPEGSEDKTEKETSAADHRGSGTVLLMDDEEVILDMEKRLLASFGYSVVCAKNGNEVIEYLSRNADSKREIVALILDLTIPGGLGGEETIRHIRKTYPDIPAFVSSGYADDPIMVHPARYGFTASIRKPFRKVELSEMLNNYLKTE